MMTFRRCTPWLFALVGCQNPHTPPPKSEPRPATASATTLGAGDVFEVRVYGEEDLSGTYRVATDGTIQFPLVGAIEVLGLTAPTASHTIARALERFVKTPNVSVFVTEFNSKKIYVLGSVRSPGTIRYEDGMTIIEAISLAGGFAVGANENGTYVTRPREDGERRIPVAAKSIRNGDEPNFSLVPGDIVYVPESIF